MVGTIPKVLCSQQYRPKLLTVCDLEFQLQFYFIKYKPEMVNALEGLNKFILRKVKRFDCKTFLVNTF